MCTGAIGGCQTNWCYWGSASLEGGSGWWEYQQGSGEREYRLCELVGEGKKVQCTDGLTSNDWSLQGTRADLWDHYQKILLAAGQITFDEFLGNLSARGFKRYLESLEGQAARAGKSTKSASETRQILDEAKQRGWRVETHPGETWRGGPHVHLVQGTGTKAVDVHLAIPSGFVP